LTHRRVDDRREIRSLALAVALWLPRAAFAQYGANLYWSAGAEFKPAHNWTLRMDGYNLIEPFDTTLSKRNYYFRLSEYNIQLASLSVSLRYHF
jgi:hypothetical protein